MMYHEVCNVKVDTDTHNDVYVAILLIVNDPKFMTNGSNH